VSCFVDTSALYAFLVRSDADHGVPAAFSTAAESARRMVTTNYVLVETVALLQHRIGLDPVRDLDGRVTPLLDAVWVSGDLHRGAIARLFRMDRRQVSLADAVSFAVMEAEGIAEVLGFDDDFAREGFRLIP
jgi:predicted nucleic acid-binding protein